MEESISEFTRASAIDTASVEEKLVETEQQIERMRLQEAELLESLIRQLEDTQDAFIARVTDEDKSASRDEKIIRLEEALEFQSNFAQIGMTVGMLGHEFEKSVAELRSGMFELKGWADNNRQLKVIYDRLTMSFGNLEGYLKLLDPLGRRLTRGKVDISGGEVVGYLFRVFGKTLDKYDIRLTATPAFERFTTSCRTASLLGAIVNLIDNGIYWVQQTTDDQRKIILDANEHGMSFSNNGPGIDPFDAKHIFEFGWTAKSGGRGMGLAIARENLAKDNLLLELTEVGADICPIFRISQIKDEEVDDDE